MSEKSYQNSCALVLGGHVNGYSIIKELYEQGIRNIVLFDYGKSLARYSNKIIYKKQIEISPESLLAELKNLYEAFKYIVIFPTDDLQLEYLHVIHAEISEFCYLPFNNETIIKATDKFFQYQVCEKNDVPYPKTINARKVDHLETIIGHLAFPLLIKPSTRKDSTVDVFRALYVETPESYTQEKANLSGHIQAGIEFVISEYIPGNDTNIYAYTCFRSQEGKILNEWTGKKLTQYPDNYGIFSSASNEAPEAVLIQGRKLVQSLGAYGIDEPEFKYDHRDGEFKLMETNFRSMMWHRMGSISGVKLHSTQYNYAVGKPTFSYQQDKTLITHFVLMLHEIPNLIARPAYWKNFKYNVFGGDKRVWAIFELNDIKPFLFSLLVLVKMGVVACRRKFRQQ